MTNSDKGINDVQESIETGGENRGYRNIRQHPILKDTPYTFNSVSWH